MVLIIFIAEIAAAVVVLVYTGLVSGIPNSWAGLLWENKRDASHLPTWAGGDGLAVWRGHPRSREWGFPLP